MADFSEKIKLTERTVTAALPASKKSKSGLLCGKLYLDTELRGLGLSVTAPSARNPEGVKSYFVMRCVNGKQERHVFGYPKELTVAEARARAGKLLAQMTDGVSLNAKRREARAEAKRAQDRGVTLRGALELYEGTLRTKHRSPRTIDGYRYFAETYLSSWLDRPLAEITRAEVRKRHADIAKEIERGKYSKRRGPGAGKVTANAAMRAFRAIYNRATREHADLPVSPTLSVDWNQEQRRTGRIPDDGFAKWYEQINAITNPVRRDYLLFALFTGLRRTNAAEVKWEHVDFERRALHVPKPKSRRPFDLPLSNFLLDLLKRRKKENEILNSDSPWVFPAANGAGHLVEVRMQGGYARKKGKAKAGASYSIHDLRRTFISVAEGIGVSREMRMLLANHSVPKADVHSNYVVPSVDALRTHMDAISAKLLALCQPPAPEPQKNNVVPLRKKKATA